MTKQELLDACLTIKANLTLAWTLIPMLDRPEYYTTLTTLSSENHNIHALLENLKTHKDHLVYYYFTTQLLNSLREYCEILKEYCISDHASHNYKIYYSDDTITFSRYIRNCITHNFEFSFKKKKDRYRVANNPPQWRGKIIDITLEGKTFNKTFMNHHDIVDLLNDLDSVVRNKII